jgi:peptidyl-prolyl cis-trans isomerase C
MGDRGRRDDRRSGQKMPPYSPPVRSSHPDGSGRRRRSAAILGLVFGLCTPPCLAQTPPAATPSQPPATGAAAKPAAPGNTLADLAAQFEKSPDTVVAEVNGTPITLGMVADRIHEFPDKFAILPPPVIYKSAVDDLIQQRALAVKARELGLDKSAETQRRIIESTDRTLGQALVRRILPELVTDKAVEESYQSTVAGKPGPQQVQFRVIATDTEADAMAALDALSKGAEFGALARKVSKDPSAFAGGEVGYAGRDKLTPEIGAVVFTLVPGQTTAFPVLSNGRWFILQVEGRRQQGTPTLADSKPGLAADLTHDAIAQILQRTRAAVVVKDYGPTGTRGRDDATPAKSH